MLTVPTQLTVVWSQLQEGCWSSPYVFTRCLGLLCRWCRSSSQHFLLLGCLVCCVWRACSFVCEIWRSRSREVVQGCIPTTWGFLPSTCICWQGVMDVIINVVVPLYVFLFGARARQPNMLGYYCYFIYRMSTPLINTIYNFKYWYQ